MTANPSTADGPDPSGGSSHLGAGLEGRGVIVTGAASGIGRAIAISMAGAGARVAAIDRDEPGLRSTLSELPGGSHLPVVSTSPTHRPYRSWSPLWWSS